MLAGFLTNMALTNWLLPLDLNGFSSVSIPRSHHKPNAVFGHAAFPQRKLFLLS